MVLIKNNIIIEIVCAVNKKILNKFDSFMKLHIFTSCDNGSG